MSRNIAQELHGSGVKVQWCCAATRGAAAVATKQTQPQPQHAGIGGEGWEGPVALPAALWLPLQPRACSPGQLCLVSFPSSIPLASVAKQQLRDGSLASASFQKTLVRVTVV